VIGEIAGSSSTKSPRVMQKCKKKKLKDPHEGRPERTKKSRRTGVNGAGGSRKGSRKLGIKRKRKSQHHYTTNSGDTGYLRELGRRNQSWMDATTNEGERNSLEKANERKNQLKTWGN
jgi:hypothetical protein